MPVKEIKIKFDCTETAQGDISKVKVKVYDAKDPEGKEVPVEESPGNDPNKEVTWGPKVIQIQKGSGCVYIAGRRWCW